MGRSNFVLGLFLSSVFALAPRPGLAQNASLTGTVYTETGNQRIDNATVILCDQQGNRLLETYTNQAGEFSFRNIHSQRYLLKIHAAGFADAELPADVTMGAQHGLSISLRGAPRSGSAVPDRATISVHELSMPQEARNLVASGRNKLYLQKNAQAALNDFQSAAAKAPAYYEAYYHAGLAYLALQNERDAENQFRKSVELSEQKYPDADIALGTLLLQRKQESEGEAYLRRGLGLNQQSWPGQIELGKLELGRGHLDLALAAAAKAQSLAPQQPFVYRLMALVHMQQKDYTALVSDLDNYIRLDPDSPAGLRAKELRADAAKHLPKTESSAAVNASTK